MTAQKFKLTDEQRDTIKVNNPIHEVMMAAGVSLRKSGGEYLGFCPFHDNKKTPALNVIPSKHFYYCQSCGATGDVITFLIDYSGLTFRAAVQQLGGIEPLSAQAQAQIQQRAAKAKRDSERYRQYAVNDARWAWALCQPLQRGDPVDSYLLGRGLDLGHRHLAQARRALRFCPAMPYWRGKAARREDRPTYPAMVGPVVHPGPTGPQVLGIHCTYLEEAPDGSGWQKLTSQEAAKVMRGTLTPGAVRLGPTGPQVDYAEGIETTLAVIQATGRVVWATLSRAGLAAVLTPPQLRESCVWSDGDLARWRRAGDPENGGHPGKDKGLTTSDHQGLATWPGPDSAFALAARLRGEGVAVQLPEPPLGRDWLDLLNREDPFEVIRSLAA